MTVADIGGFKLKLAAYFVLLSFLPLAAAGWAFSAVAGRSVRNEVDTRLEGGLRASLAAYDDELAGAQQEAEALARDPAFQAALRGGDKLRLARIVAANPRVRLVGPGGLRLGIRRLPAATRRVSVVSPAGTATVAVSVPLDAALVRRLRARSGLAEKDALVLAQGGRIVAAAPSVRGGFALESGKIHTAELGGRQYRGLAVQVDADERVSLAAVTPQPSIVAAERSLQGRLLLGLASGLLLIGAIAYVAGRSIVKGLSSLVAAAHAIAAGRLDERVQVRGRDEFAALGRAFNDMAGQLQQRLADLEDERRRLRDATGRFAEALGATHDTDRLLHVIVETAVEATGASGGYLLGEDGAMVHVGDPHAGPASIRFPLHASRTSFGTLVLLGERFEHQATMTAASLADQAAVALENARLHRVVERQALVDGLTGLANRRHLEQELTTAMARAQRAGGSVALILADLDDFKQVNDAHGHGCGDDVLREFAGILREVVREADVPGRWGGEEFAVVVPDADTDGAALVADRIRSTLEERAILTPDGARLHVTTSIGVASYPAARERSALLDAADEALYRAKRAGKNRVATVTGVRDGA